MLTFDKENQNCLKHVSSKIIKFHSQYVNFSLNGQLQSIVGEARLWTSRELTLAPLTVSAVDLTRSIKVSRFNLLLSIHGTALAILKGPCCANHVLNPMCLLRHLRSGYHRAKQTLSRYHKSKPIHFPLIRSTSPCLFIALTRWWEGSLQTCKKPVLWPGLQGKQAHGLAKEGNVAKF